jgi:hypothetical protein
MPDIPNTLASDATIQTKRETVETLDAQGNNLPKNSALEDIFSQVERGVPVQDAIKEVNAKQEPASPPPEEKKEEAPAKTEEAAKPEPSDLEKKLNAQEEQKSEEVTREALKKQAEQVAEKAPEPKADETKPEEKKADDVPDDELTVLPYDKPKTAKRIQALLKKIDAANDVVTRTKKEAEEKAKRLSELEQELSTVKTKDPATDEAIKKQLEQDPEVKTKFDSRVESSESSIIDTLKRRNAGDALLNLIKEEGGWTKFSESGRAITLADGTSETCSSIAEKIMGTLPLGERKAIEAAMIDQIATRREKSRYFDEETKKADEYFKKQAEQQKQAVEVNQQAVKQAEQAVANWRKEVAEKNAWLKLKDIPADATADQKKAIEEDNTYTKQLNQLLDQSLKAKDLNALLDIVLDSVQYYQERRLHSRAVARIAALEKENAALRERDAKFKEASKSAPKSGSIVSGASAQPQARAKPVGLEAALEEIASGKSDSEE